MLDHAISSPRLTHDSTGLPRPLAGTRVLDLTNVLAGPYCTYQLALMGAEVIKIEMPGRGDLARQLGADPALNRELLGTSFLAQNGGKKSVSLNLKDSRGQEIFLELVTRADVIVENFRPGVMDGLGLGYEILRSVRPDLVYCAISGFGQDGPLRQNPAYDQIVQGLSGIMSITGGPDTAPLRVGFPICDTFGGMTAAFAIVTALMGRAAGQGGRFIDVAILESTLTALGWAASNFLIAGVPPHPMGNENMTAAPSGTFKTADGLLNISANEQRQFEALCTAIGASELVRDPRYRQRDARKAHRASLREAIEAHLAQASAQVWEERLNEVGVPAGRILTVAEALSHEQVLSRELIQEAGATRDDRTVRVLASGFRLSEGRLGPLGPPPVLGEHTGEVLAELGIGLDTFADLRAGGVI